MPHPEPPPNPPEGIKEFGVTATAIIFKNGTILLTRRSPDEAVLPGLWTVPGGKMTTDDFVETPRTTIDAWYGVLEKVVAREVLEETGVKIGNIGYVTNAVAIYPKRVALIVSFMADYQSGRVRLDADHSEYAWVGPKEAVRYDLIEGIADEIKKAARLRGLN